MPRAIRLTLGRVEARLPDLSAVDAFDITLLRFIEEKYSGIAPLAEINALAVVGALAPKWKEMISLPQLGPLIPEELMRSVSAGLAERELSMRLEKLERLGLIERLPGGEEEKGRIMLTDVGRAIATLGGIPLKRRRTELLAFLSRLRIELPPEPSYILQPGEKVIIVPREELELKNNEIAFIFPAPSAALFGIQILSNIIEGPYSGPLELVIQGGYVPIQLESGADIARAIVLETG